MENSPHENERIDFVNFDVETPTVRFTKMNLINLIQKILIIVLLVSLIGVVCWHFLVKDSSENDFNISLFSFQSSHPPITDTEIVRKREFIREMAREAWDAYSRVAWGHEALIPVNRPIKFNEFGNDSGLTFVNSMSTLWTMGLMGEFEKGKQWIETEMDLSKIDFRSRLFEAVTYYVGGLLSCYALTGDVMFRDKAKQIALILEPAFSNPSGIPYQNNLPHHRYPFGSIVYLSHIAGYQMDFFYLSDSTGETRFRNQIYKIREVLNKYKYKNLYFSTMKVEGGWSINDVDLFSYSKEFYSNLVKSFIQSNQNDVQSIEMYKEAMDAVEAVKMFDISRTGCHVGAMLSMGANAMQRALTLNKTISPNERREELYRIYRHSMLAERLTETCHQASIRTRTGLGPDAFWFDSTHDATNWGGTYYYMSPELAESYFILWRLTRDVKYRDYAWEMAQAIHRHCRVNGNGYSSIDNVDQIPTSKSNYQPPNFLGATLKYLYLTFSDDTLLPLDQWIFNAQGHPLPICGKNPAYPEDKCKS